MSHGGKRTGAGRKKGVGNKSSEEARQRALDSGESPLDYMLKIMRDPKAAADRRDDMARAAAPYVHAKLQTTTIQGDEEGGPIAITWLKQS